MDTSAPINLRYEDIALGAEFETTTVTATSAALRAGQLEAALNINETPNLLEKGIAKTWVRDTDITFALCDKLLAQAFADALTAIRADGTYDKLFDKFGMTKLKATTFVIRGDGSPNLRRRTATAGRACRGFF